MCGWYCFPKNKFVPLTCAPRLCPDKPLHVVTSTAQRLLWRFYRMPLSIRPWSPALRYAHRWCCVWFIVALLLPLHSTSLYRANLHLGDPSSSRQARMAMQYLTVPVNSAFPERLFSSVGLVKCDLQGRPKFWTPPWLTWCGLNKHPKLNLKVSKRKSTITRHTHSILTHDNIYVTSTHQYLSLEHTYI